LIFVKKEEFSEGQELINILSYSGNFPINEAKHWRIDEPEYG